jgi:hypothetical protein
MSTSSDDELGLGGDSAAASAPAVEAELRARLQLLRAAVSRNTMHTQ